MPSLCRAEVLLLVAFASASVSAQTYKWVDERGVVNYSSQPPAGYKTARKLVLVEERISVYTPEKALLRAIESAPLRGGQVLSDKIDRLERQLEAERQSRQYAAGADARALSIAYEQCLAQRRVDCNESFSGYYPY